MKTALEERVIKERIDREAAEQDPLAGDEPEEVEDSLDAGVQKVLNIEPSARETLNCDTIADVIAKFAPDFCHFISDEEIGEMAKTCVYHFFRPGANVCDADEECEFFFVVLRGSVQIEERQVYHQEGAKGVEASQMRVTQCLAGKGFHHYPLVMNNLFYGYSARVVDPIGASVILLTKQDYVHALRKQMEKEMMDTVNILKGTQFFSAWSEMSISRLYFWFDRRRLPTEANVVTQGDDADFCFIIRSGRCDVLVEVADEDAEDEGGALTPSASRNSSPMTRRAGEDGAAEESTSAAAKLKDLSKKRKQTLKMNAAAAFLGGNKTDAPMRANMRHVATLRAGAIVGEIALFKTGEKRMATVRTSDATEILTLDKKSFLDLDRATLNIISENARYNAACTKEPSQRTRDDLQILQSRTAHLSHISALSSEVHAEICRVMRFRQINEGAILVRKGHAAKCLMIIISGSVATHVAEPRLKGWGAIKDVKFGKDGMKKKRAVPVEAYSGLKPTEVLKAGQAIGEDELLQEDPVYGATAITAESVELMEIEREDFDRILKADRTSEKGLLIDFLNGLSMMDGTSVAAIHNLSNVVSRKTFMRDQLMLAHPPDPALGASSFSYDFVYLIFSGEARLLCGGDGSHETRPAPTIDSASPAFGPLIEVPPPGASKVQKHLGNMIVPIAELGPGECVSDNLLPSQSGRWALRAVTSVDLLVIPRKEWVDTLRSSSMAELREITQSKAAFFQKLLEHVIEQPMMPKQMLSRTNSSKLSLASAMTNNNGVSSPRKEDRNRKTLLAPLASPAPSARRTASPERSASPDNSPRLQRSSPRRSGSEPVLPQLKDPAARPRSLGEYTPPIRTMRKSQMGSRPMVMGS